MEKYIPDVYQKSIFTINYQKLLDKGIKCLLFDLDNTLIPYKQKKPNKKIIELFDDLKKMGFEIIIFSNASKNRVREFVSDLDIKYYYSCLKPLPKSFLLALKENDYNVCDVAIIGDQLLTDILGGNKIGITTVLINPISTKDSISTKFTRFFEKKIMKKMRNLNLFSQGKYYD